MARTASLDAAQLLGRIVENKKKSSGTIDAWRM